MNEADRLANHIREIDGKHDMGAGKLAEALVEKGWVFKDTYTHITPERLSDVPCLEDADT